MADALSLIVEVVFLPQRNDPSVSELPFRAALIVVSQQELFIFVIHKKTNQ